MDYEVVILDLAQQDIRAIVDYLVNILKSPSAASGFLDELNRQVSLIKTNPDLFAVSRTPELAAKNYHSVQVNNYLMLYSVRDIHIYIAHVFHQTQDYARLV